MSRVYLKYMGPGRIPDIPPRDLTVDEINLMQKEHPECDDIALALVGTGYYEFYKIQSPQAWNKSLFPRRHNKFIG